MSSDNKLANQPEPARFGSLRGLEQGLDRKLGNFLMVVPSTPIK
jgi:hypothetical protein